jgi:hypothetical protein
MSSDFGAAKAYLMSQIEPASMWAARGTAASFGVGRRSLLRVWIVGRPEPLSETGAERRVVARISGWCRGVGWDRTATPVLIDVICVAPTADQRIDGVALPERIRSGPDARHRSG